MIYTIAFLGTGILGSRIAQKLIAAGYTMLLYNRTMEKAKWLLEYGGYLLETPEEAIKPAQLVVCMVSDYNAANSVLFPNDNIDYTGKAVYQMSTVSPQENIILKQKVEERGGVFIECPVLGSVPQAESGELIVMMGCQPQQFEYYKGLFNHLSLNMVHTGEVGTAAATKLALNQLIASMSAAFETSYGYLKAYGADVDKFMGILKNSALFAPTFEKKLPNIENRKFEPAHFTAKMLLKDVNLITNAFAEKNIDVAPLQGVKQILEKTVEKNFGDMDYSVMYNVIYPDNK